MKPIFKNKGVQSWISSFSVLLGLFILITYIHIEELRSLVGWWWSTTKYGHSILTFPVILYLIYDKRNELKCFTPQIQPWLLPVLIVLSIGISLFNIISIQVISESLTIFLYAIAVWLIMGTVVTSIIAIPLLLLLTVVPVWELVSPILTQATATVVYYFLNFLSVPVFREGDYLTIPEGVFEIAESCGGFRYFIVGISLGLIYAYQSFETLKQRLLIISLALLLSIVTNWIRVMIVIWAGHTTNMQHHFVHAHVNLGWWIFAVAFALFFLSVSRIPLKSIRIQEIENESDRIEGKSSYSYRLYGVSIIALIIISIVPLVISTSFKTDAKTQERDRGINPFIDLFH